jgi:hypothetical protein
MLKMLYKLGTQAQVLGSVRVDFEQQNVLVNLANKCKEPNGSTGFSRARQADEVLAEFVKAVDVKSIGLDVSTLIVLRGILMALLLDDGADTSILYEPDFRDSVVKVL